MILREVFIYNLKRVRKEKKISQMKLAELCESSTNYIGEIEIGKKFPSVEMIQKISDALKIKPYLLFMEIETIQTQKSVIEIKESLIKKIQCSVKEIIETEYFF